MTGLFVDPARGAALDADSYVVVPFLRPEDVASLRAAYAELVGHEGAGIQIDFIREDRALVRRLYEVLQPLLEERVAELMVDTVPVASSFVVKHPDAGSAMFPHRDIPVQDERSGRCFTLWSPLTDVGPELGNGCLEVVPGSERLPSAAMGPTTPLLYAPFLPTLQEHRRPVPMRAGDAMVFDARLLHGSPPNRTEGPRIAVGCALARRSRPLVRIHATGRRHRQVVEVDADFFVDRHPLDRWEAVPAGLPVIDEFDDHATLTPAVVAATLGLPTPPEPVVQVPVDISEPGPPGGPGPLAWRGAVDVGHEADLVVRAADLPAPDPVAGLDVVAQEGDAGLYRATPYRWGRRPIVAVVDPYARLTVEPQGGAGWEACVLECPAVRSGARTADGAVAFDLGHRRLLPAGHRTTLWNDGPGALVVLLRRLPTGPLADLFGRLTRRPLPALGDWTIHRSPATLVRGIGPHEGEGTTG